jgi:hypothetical protein
MLLLKPSFMCVQTFHPLAVSQLNKGLSSMGLLCIESSEPFTLLITALLSLAPLFEWEYRTGGDHRLWPGDSRGFGL